MLLTLAGLALGADCTLVTLAEVVSIDAPAVLVLGERKGTQPDLSRAAKMIKKLRAKAHVTLALEAIEQSEQLDLDRYADGTLAADALPDAVGWQHHWGFPYAPYLKLLSLSDHQVDLVAAGTYLVPDVPNKAPVPAGYDRLLADAVAGAPLLPDVERSVAQTMAWADHRIATASHRSWNGEGYLVVLTDRSRVEGGKGVNWQLDQLTEAPVHSVLLGGGQASCYAGDRYMK